MKGRELVDHLRRVAWTAADRDGENPWLDAAEEIERLRVERNDYEGALRIVSESALSHANEVERLRADVTDAEQRGRELERAAIVGYLREKATLAARFTGDASESATTLSLADGIEGGEHLKGER